jgi:hypothetical protein
MGRGCGGFDEVVIPLFQQLRGTTDNDKGNTPDPDLLNINVEFIHK